jgi:acyl-CoA synthetase (AMP-forming)/AMP-acid ligase II
MSLPDWSLRSPPPVLARRYRDAGLWTGETLGEYLDDCLRAIPGLDFRVWSSTRPYASSLGAMRALALRAAGGLRARGVGPGDVVAFQLPNWMEAAVAFWGLALLGATIVPIVHFYGTREVRFILEDSGARFLVTADRFGSRDYLAALDELAPQVARLEGVFVVGAVRPRTTPFAELLEADPIAGAAAADPAAPALVAYTSGTTANPKGVIHTHRSVVAEIRSKLEFRVLPKGARPNLVGAPVSHAMGMLGALLMPLAWQEPVHMTDVWDPAAVLRAMLEGKLSSGSGSPYFLTSLLDHPDFSPAHLEYLRFAILGGASVPLAVSERAEALGIAIARGYGSTEHPTVTACMHHEPRAKRLHTDGHALPGVELRLVDERGREVAPGEWGEVQSRGPDLFAGYTDAALSAAALDADGWFLSGDIGVLDADGYLTITDRKKDIIIRGGEKVSSAEVEDCLLRMPGVAEVAVVPVPDPRLGERGCAVVRLAADAPVPDLAALRAHLAREGLAKQKWPEELRLVDDFPRTPSGKIRKNLLREALRAGHAPPEG